MSGRTRSTRTPRPAVTVRPYGPHDRAFYERAIAALQDHIVALDPTGDVQRPTGFGPRYARIALRQLRRSRGRLFIAQLGRRRVGFVACLVRPRQRQRELELRPRRHGFVMDLFVEEDARSRGVGSALLDAAERYLAGTGCERVWLDVFVPNVRAHALYRRRGYVDFGVVMRKRLPRRG